MVPKIKIELTANPDSRVYRTTLKISQDPIFHSFWRPLRPSNKYLERIGKVGTSLVIAVMDITGVTRVAIGPYELCVEKASLFEWEGIEPQVIKALENKTEERVIYPLGEALKKRLLQRILILKRLLKR